MLKLSPYYLQKPFLLLHIQRIQCQPLHIRSGKHHLIIAGIDIRTRRCTQHTPLSGSFGKSQMILLQYHPFGVDELHTHLHRLPRSGLLFKTKGIDLCQTGRDIPGNTAFLTFTKEDTGLFLDLFLYKLAFQHSVLGLISHIGTGIFIFRQ